MPELTRLDGIVARLNVDNADGVLYIMLENSREKHILRIPHYLDVPTRAILNLTTPGDNVAIDVDDSSTIRRFTNVMLDD